MLTVLEAAKRVLEEVGAPMRVRDLTAAMLGKGYWQTQGLTPEATVQARLATDLNARGEASPFVRPEPGVYGLKGQAVPPSLEPQPSAECRPLFEDEELDPAAASDSLSFTEAAIEVLQELDPPRPLHYRDITRIALERKLLSTTGKTPEATMYAQILTEIDRYKRRGLLPRFQKLGQGLVALAGTPQSGRNVPWSVEDQALLDRVKSIQPVQFERLVSNLLTQMFGAEVKETQYSQDRGVDARGVVTLKGGIKIEVVAQAKRHTSGRIGRPDIQGFRGSMKSQSLGIFITTSSFGRNAVIEAERPDATHPIGLIHGRELIGLMKEHRVGLDAQGEPLLLEEPPVAAVD